MYRNKKDVDKHVVNLISKLSVKEFKTRAYSIARLYYEVGDYASCKSYVEQYLTQKDNNAAAYKLLGQAFQKLGQKEKALEQYKTSLDIDPAQTSTILDICELLADDEVTIDPGRAKYWCEKAEATFPRHPVTFKMRERLTTLSNPDPEALVNLLTTELEARPKDALLHIRLLRLYIQTNEIQKAIDHVTNLEFGAKTFLNNYAWYETLVDLLKHHTHNHIDWLFQLLSLTVYERICVLSLTETPSGSSKSLVETNELLHVYDQAIEVVAKAGPTPGYAEFHTCLLQHHRGQFAFIAATFLLKKAKKDQLSWRDATKFAAPLMLIAWHTTPQDLKVNWLTHATEKQQQAAHRWHTEGAYRCSQSGHYLLSNIKDQSQVLLDRISQCCSGTHWRDKLYEKIFTSGGHLTKIKTSHITSNLFTAPVLRLPRKIEVESQDMNAQKEYPNSLHHFVWTLLNYKNFAHFKCTLFDMLTPTTTNCGPETLNKLDIHAFLYSAALTARQNKSNEISYVIADKPIVLPANITDLLCSLPQMKWWDCAYKFSQNELGTELTDIRATLSRGIEVVRCVDSHGLDPELLCTLGRIFSEKAKLTTIVNEKNTLEIRAGLYYSSAIPLLEKLKCKIVVKMPEKRMFDYTHKELSTKDLISLIEESKLFVAINHLNECEYDKVIEILSNLKSAQALYYLGLTYKKIAIEENNTSKDADSIETKTKFASLLTRARNYAYKALDSLRNSGLKKDNTLYSDTQVLIEDIETYTNKIDLDISTVTINDGGGKYSSDENVSFIGSEYISARPNSHVFRNISSTPKQSNPNVTNYRTAVDSHILESTRGDQQYLERIENEIKNLQKRDHTISDFMEQSKTWFEENRKLSNQIISTIHSNIQNTTDQFKLLKISVDHVKDQIDECRNECKDVGDLKKQIAELKKEVNKLKKASSEQTIDESDLYNLDDDYRTNDSTSTFAAQLPFTPPQVIPTFNQRLVPPFPVPPNPYQLYGQNLYNFYSQYPQFAQTTQVPGAPPIFDPTRAPINYPGMYTTPDQMYLDVTQLVTPNVPPVPAVSSIPSMSTVPTLPTMPTASTAPAVTIATSINAVSAIATKPNHSLETKEIPRSLPVNVVITSSDPLPKCTTTPAPILSVTIPSKHIKGTAHNYQIPMPSTSETNVMTPPIFSFPSGNKPTNTTSPFTNWNQSSVFKSQTPNSTKAGNISTDSLSLSTKVEDTLDNSKTVVDGIFSGSSPNTSLNKSRTLSERSNTSVENYDPCPDFKPIIPLPAEVKVTTGEEDEIAIFSSRAKLFRFVDKQWKERGLGDMKLLKHKITGKVRVLMRREQIHKICANHIITSEMEIKPMKNETKAYFWVANDFADETVVLEKFCIRFKTTEIAQKFYEDFEKARQESSIVSASTPKAENRVKEFSSNPTSEQISTPMKSTTEQSTTQAPKAVIGGFTFISTPTFKPVESNVKSDVKTSEATTKSNVFSGLSFKSTTNSPFSNLFNTTSNQTTPDKSKEPTEEMTNKLNNSDTVEEFEPNVEFKPVVPLPALVEQRTGEEDENILFEHRAKLLRFDASSKEWKERGLGNIKLLVNKDNIQKVRLLMRREQIMKVCCNHAITKEIVFQKMPNMDKAVTWAKDFSDGELVAETFCLRFKTVQACDNFIDAIKTAQSKMKDDSKAAKEEQNAAKQVNQIGFGDKFKPKAGSWYCETCYTNNLESFNKCACCEQPNPNSSIIKNTVTPVSSSWGESFKPKPGTWECKQCLIRNEDNVECCSACATPKDPTATKTELKLTSENAPKFNFGIPANTNTVIEMEKNNTVSIASGWGDKFKPKEGTWECKECFVRNEANIENCSACNNPKDPSSVKQEPKSLFGLGTTASKFSFGIPSSTATEQKSTIVSTTTAQTTSIFDGTGAHKFSFGIPSNTQEKGLSVISFGDKKPLTSSVFGTLKTSNDSIEPVDFSVNKKEELKIVTPTKPALLPTPQTENSSTGTPLGKEGGTFDFVFKPKTPTKGKSPIKSPTSQKGDDSDGNEYASEDEGHHIHFSPVIPMPDKVDVVTGEENETELYGHRAKLFRFVSGEWKERGIGVVKILKHKDTGKVRVVMRREQVLKICLNHVLSSNITYTPKDDKTWLFAANDFSEGELNLQQFCLRFKTNEIALEYKDAIDKAREIKKEVVNDTTEFENTDDVVFVREIQASSEEKAKAKALMLPENFFTYNNKEPCSGCRGCQDDDVVKPAITTNITVKASPFALSTPMKTSNIAFQSPTPSLYGTPANFDKSLDTSMFRTPLGAIGTNTKSTTLTSNNNSMSENDSTNKENSFNQNSSVQSGVGEQKTLFSLLQNKPVNANEENQQTSSVSKSTILAAPKLSNLNTSGDEKAAIESKSLLGSAQSGNQNADPKTIFAQANPLLGNSGKSMNQSIFGVPSDKKDEKSEIKSIFGSNDQKPVDLFSNASKGSIFGTGTLGNSQINMGTSIFGSSGKSIFSTSVTQSQGFGNSNSIFGNAAITNNQWTTVLNMGQKTGTVTSNGSEDKKTDDIKLEDVTTKQDTPFKVDNSLSFAALSSSAPGFQKKADFKWEGAGQQLFGKDADKSKNDSVGEEAGANVGGDEEYDPHYEPIVPLPDKIVVTTGEEDEEKLFGERCKLYRYDDKSREWKERGVGEMKILYHPDRKSYRLLLRREQVHKAVLNMLVFMDLELLPMKNSDRSWTWAGRNYAETPTGEQETLAVRFKSPALATAFHDKIVECVRKLQAQAAQAIREEKESKANAFGVVAPLRLPKHLENSARADNTLLAKAAEHAQSGGSAAEPGTAEVETVNPNGEVNKGSSVTEIFKQVHFQDPEEENQGDEDDEDDEEGYEHEYDHNEDYDGYYNEDEEESSSYYSCDGEVVVRQGDVETACEHGHIQVLYDQDIYSPKILITDSATGEILADMLIHTDTEFQMTGDTCIWSGTDYTSNDPIYKTVTVNFHDSETAMMFYDSCETSKAATYTSTDPES
ncbi:LOW QUALITY PROTEIN: E3 SUMO-protein ligase RanBP2 [Aphomia sociella]